MEYRTKAAVKIIAGLTKSEAFELFNIVGASRNCLGKEGRNYVHWIKKLRLHVPADLWMNGLQMGNWKCRHT